VGRRIIAAAVILVCCCSSAARAQQSMKLEFRAGRVTLYAQNVSISQILAEWGRISGARIVNGERVTGGAVTLELVDVPEREVLDILLRRVSGYIIAPRPAGSPGTSTFDPILIMPTSSAPSNPPRGSGLIEPSSAPAQLVSEATQLEPSQSRGRAPEDEGEPSNTPPQNSQQLGPRDANGELPRMPLPVQHPTTASRGVPPSPGNPFGIPFGSSATPGVVTPVPPPADPYPGLATDGRPK
jgi:hypothetical protein